MGWASGHIERLRQGQAVVFRPRGHSMAPRVKDGQLCAVAPLGDEDVLAVDDVVLCKVNGREYLHLIRAISGDRLQIGNHRGGINGWVGRRAVFGRLTSVSD